MQFSTRIQFNIGFESAFVESPIIRSLNSKKYLPMFLGLALHIVLAVLTLLSVALIYSVLLIDVETRTLHVGILRMLGATTGGVTCIVLLQVSATARLPPSNTDCCCRLFALQCRRCCWGSVQPGWCARLHLILSKI